MVKTRHSGEHDDIPDYIPLPERRRSSKLPKKDPEEEAHESDADSDGSRPRRKRRRTRSPIKTWHSGKTLRNRVVISRMDQGSVIKHVKDEVWKRTCRREEDVGEYLFSPRQTRSGRMVMPVMPILLDEIMSDSDDNRIFRTRSRRGRKPLRESGAFLRGTRRSKMLHSASDDGDEYLPRSGSQGRRGKGDGDIIRLGREDSKTRKVIVENLEGHEHSDRDHVAGTRNMVHANEVEENDSDLERNLPNRERRLEDDDEDEEEEKRDIRCRRLQKEENDLEHKRKAYTLETDNEDDKDYIIGKKARSSRIRHENIDDKDIEKENMVNGNIAVDNNEDTGGFVRRSTRQRKLLYDSFNTSWILGTQQLKGYPMFENRSRTVTSKGEEMERERIEEEEMERRGIRKHLTSDAELVALAPADDGYADMYSRVKRPHRPVERMMYPVEPSKRRRRKDEETSEEETTESDSDTEEEDMVAEQCEGETTADESQGYRRGKYHLRQKKPVVKPFQVTFGTENNQSTRSGFDRGDSPPRRHRVGSFICSPARKSISWRKRSATHHSSNSSSSSDDEERFERKRAKSMAQARNRCLPMNMTSENISHGVLRERARIGASLADVDPMNIDTSVTFESIGGLQHHLQRLKEMILFPLLYPEVFEKFKIEPPRGVLFYGPPGTGKTLVARALANECRQGDKRVAFFMRKGADCLSKWVGESERQLRLLFDQAYQMRPSIIFFDEIDGLAPVRSSRQDQIHSSIVSTLLALMDGLDSRGEVVVIGSTNMIDAIDPALRRPGRFDREFHFPLPSAKARHEILKIHMKAWNPKPTKAFMKQMSEKSFGYCGADLKALCAEAALIALRRRYPQIYKSREKLVLDVSSIKVSKIDFLRAMNSIVPAGQRVASSPGRKLPAVIQPLLQGSVIGVIGKLRVIFPQGFAKISGSKQVFFPCWSHRPRMVLAGTPLQGQSTYLAPALLHHMEGLPVHKLDLPALFAVTAKTPEESCAQIFHEARRNLPSILYVPHIGMWWETVSETVRATFLSLLQEIEPSAPLLLLATSDCLHQNFMEEVKDLFSVYQGEVFTMESPGEVDRREFFQDLFLRKAVQPPRTLKKRACSYEVLPLAPPPQPRTLTLQEFKKLNEQDEATYRELRIFLREICGKLARNKLFYLFTKPVDVDEVNDYLDIVKNPMDLETMMSNIDRHQYESAKMFLDDIDLICRNALEYNPDKTPADKLIRHRACTLKDTAHALIKAEMDSDFEGLCQEIHSRRVNFEAPFEKPPDFVQTKLSSSVVSNPGHLDSAENMEENGSTMAAEKTANSLSSSKEPAVKNKELQPKTKELTAKSRLFEVPRKRRRSAWSRGLLKKKKRSVQKLLHPPNAIVNKAASEKQQRKNRYDHEIVFGKRVSNSMEEMSVDSDEETEEDNLRQKNHDLVRVKEKEIKLEVLQQMPKKEYLIGRKENSPKKSSPDKESPKTQKMNENCNSIDTGDQHDTDPVKANHSTKNTAMSTKNYVLKHSSVTATSDQQKVVKGDSQSPCGRTDRQCGSKVKEGKKGTLPADKEKEPEENEEAKKEVIIDRKQLCHLLADVVKVTDGYPVEVLERVYTKLSRCISKHSQELNKTALLKDIEEEIKIFQQHCPS